MSELARLVLRAALCAALAPLAPAQDDGPEVHDFRTPDGSRFNLDTDRHQVVATAGIRF